MVSFFSGWTPLCGVFSFVCDTYIAANKSPVKLKMCFLTAAFFYILSACDDNDVKKSQSSAWHPHPAFRLETKIVLNSHSTKDKIFFYGPRFFFALDKSGRVTNAGTILSYPGLSYLPIADDFFVRAGISGNVTFANSEFPGWDEGEAFVAINPLEPQFKNLILTYYHAWPTIETNESNQCIVPIEVDGMENYQFYLFNVNRSDGGLIHVTDTVKVTLPAEGNQWIYIKNIHGFSDYFIVSTGHGVFKIYGDGKFKKLIDYGVQMFTANKGRLFGFEQPQRLHVSDDEGETWKTYEGLPELLSISDYSNVGDSLVGYSRDGLFTFKLDGINYSLRPLDNDVVKGNEITSITEFQDSVYVTTMSGVFVKSKRYFFDGLN